MNSSECVYVWESSPSFTVWTGHASFLPVSLAVSGQVAITELSSDHFKEWPWDAKNTLQVYQMMTKSLTSFKALFKSFGDLHVEANRRRRHDY